MYEDALSADGIVFELLDVDVVDKDLPIHDRNSIYNLRLAAAQEQLRVTLLQILGKNPPSIQLAAGFISRKYVSDVADRSMLRHGRPKRGVLLWRRSSHQLIRHLPAGLYLWLVCECLKDLPQTPLKTSVVEGPNPIRCRKLLNTLQADFCRNECASRGRFGCCIGEQSLQSIAQPLRPVSAI